MPVVAFTHARDGSHLAPMGVGWSAVVLHVKRKAHFCDNRKPHKTNGGAFSGLGGVEIGAVLPGAYVQTPLCDLAKQPRLRGRLD